MFQAARQPTAHPLNPDKTSRILHQNKLDTFLPVWFGNWLHGFWWFSASLVQNQALSTKELYSLLDNDFKTVLFPEVRARLPVLGPGGGADPREAGLQRLAREEDGEAGAAQDGRLTLLREVHGGPLTCWPASAQYCIVTTIVEQLKTHLHLYSFKYIKLKSIQAATHNPLKVLVFKAAVKSSCSKIPRIHSPVCLVGESC